MSTLDVTYNIVAPLFIAVALIVVANRYIHIDAQGISRLVIYVFSPALLIDRLANMQITSTEAAQLVGIAILTGLTLGIVAFGVARLLRYDRGMAAAFVLCALMTNNGNFGLPLNRFAFGIPGEERALLYFVGGVILTNTVGVFVASRGRVSTRDALRNMLSVPLPYAAALGFFLNIADLSLPTPAARSASLLGDAAIPGMIAVLGIRLSQLSVSLGQMKPVMIMTALKLMIAPVVGIGLAALLGLSGVTRQVGITQASMPTAVMASIFAAEFGSESEFVTATIVTTTLVSMITLSVLLSFLM